MHQLMALANLPFLLQLRADPHQHLKVGFFDRLIISVITIIHNIISENIRNSRGIDLLHSYLELQIHLQDVLQQTMANHIF